MTTRSRGIAWVVPRAALLFVLVQGLVGCNPLASKKAGDLGRSACQNDEDHANAPHPFHTIPIDTLKDFASLETFPLEAPGGYRAAIAWDQCTLYLGYTVPAGDSIDQRQASFRYVLIYIDSDPLGETGTENAKSFGSMDWKLPFQANYLIAIRTDGEVVQRADSVFYDGNAQMYRWLSRTLPTVSRTWKEMEPTLLRIGGTRSWSEGGGESSRSRGTDGAAATAKWVADSTAVAQRFLADSIAAAQQFLADSIANEQKKLADSIAAAQRDLARQINASTPANDSAPSAGPSPDSAHPAPSADSAAGGRASRSGSAAATPTSPAPTAARRRYIEELTAAYQRRGDGMSAARRRHDRRSGTGGMALYLEVAVDLATIGDPCAIRVAGWVVNTLQDTSYAYWPASADPLPERSPQADSATATQRTVDSLAAKQSRRTDSMAVAQQRRADNHAAAQRRHADSVMAAQQRFGDSIAVAQGWRSDAEAAAIRRRADSLSAVQRRHADSLAAVQRRLADSLAALLRRRADSTTHLLRRSADSAAPQEGRGSFAAQQPGAADSAASNAAPLRVGHYYGFQLVDGIRPTAENNLDRISFPQCSPEE